MPVRLLATDLDGTLLHSDNTISVRTRDALQAAEANGLIVVFVTGRPPRWLHEVAVATGHAGISVAANGALIYDLHDERVLQTHPLSPDQLAGTVDALSGGIPDVHFAVEYGLEFAYEPDYRHDWEVTPVTDRRGRPMPAPIVTDLAGLTHQPAIKLLAKAHGAEPDPFMDSVERLVGERVTVTRSGHSPLVEISAPGVTKASGLAAVAAHYGVSSDEVAAVGDMPNDVPMLRWAGRSYAVANAHPSAATAAGARLVSNDEDAVAELVERILAENADGRTADGRTAGGRTAGGDLSPDRTS